MHLSGIDSTNNSEYRTCRVDSATLIVFVAFGRLRFQYFIDVIDTTLITINGCEEIEYICLCLAHCFLRLRAEAS